MSAPRTVACLAGDGVGPELMGEATRVLAAVARLHGVRIADVHLPFGGEAVTRCGHALPAATRSGYRDVEAILVAAPGEPALEGVMADLDPTWQVARVPLPDAGDLLVFGPVGPGAETTAVARAFDAAAERRGRVVSVGSSPRWRETVDAEAEKWPGMTVDHRTLRNVLAAFREGADLDVVVADADLVGAIVDAASHTAGTTSATAVAWMSEEGPGVFAPVTTDPDDDAGFGVADPAGVLLTAALLLSEGLRRRTAARTLERAVGDVLRNGSGNRDTRAFTDAVIARLNDSRTDTEHFAEALS